MLDNSDILKAHDRIRDLVLETPLIYADHLSRLINADIYLKCENFQKTGSFKIRGALNLLLSLDKKDLKKGVVASSAGNHAQGVAAACHLLKIPCTIVMPKTSPLVKVQNTKSFGAKIIQEGNFYDDAFKKAKEIEKSSGAYFVHPFADARIMAGQGTVAIEIEQQAKKVIFDELIIPVGGGGLSSGIATYFKKKHPKTKIKVVSSVHAPNMIYSLQKGKIQSNPNKQSFADGLNVKTVDERVFSYLKTLVDEAVVVEEDSIVVAMGLLMERCKMMVEGSAAVGIAHILENQRKYKGKKLCLIISGANVDLSLAGDIADRYLSKIRRHVWLRCIIIDKPGNLARLTKVFAEQNVNILQVFQEHSLSRELEFNYTEVKVELEFEDQDHYKAVKKILNKENISFERL